MPCPYVCNVDAGLPDRTVGMPCPYDICLGTRCTVGDPNDPVHMIWHDDKRVQFDVTKMFWNITPTSFDRRPEGIEAQTAFENVTEEGLTTSRADRNEIGAGLCVIVSPQPD